MPLTLNGSGTITGADWGASGGGLVKITTQSFSAVSSVSVNNCFSSTYDNYRLILQTTASSGVSELGMRMRVANTDTTSGYNKSRIVAAGAGVDASTDAAATSQGFQVGLVHNGASFYSTAASDIFNPALAMYTQQVATICYFDNVYKYVLVNTGYLANATSYDGFTITSSTGTITGTLTVYGYTK